MKALQHKLQKNGEEPKVDSSNSLSGADEKHREAVNREAHQPGIHKDHHENSEANVDKYIIRFGVVENFGDA